MTDERESNRRHPHLFLPDAPQSEPFQRRGGGGQSFRVHSVANRQGHAADLRLALSEASRLGVESRQAWADELRGEGIIIEVRGWPGGFELAVESLDLRGSGIELLAVVPSSEEPPRPELATVYVPDQSIGQFFRRIDEYAERDTRHGRPRNERLVANISQLRLAALQSLWTDVGEFPQTEQPTWWEIWLRRTGNELTIVREVSARLGWQITSRPVGFPSRTVVTVRATTGSLARALASAVPIAEIRRANLAHAVMDAPGQVQREVLAELAERTVPADGQAPAVCLLDTGVHRHALLRGSLDEEDVHAVVAPDGVDRHGHGTAMGGLALFGDLASVLATTGPIRLDHRLESVKILPDPGAPGNPPETFGAVTADGVTAPEANMPQRRRVYSLSCSTSPAEPDGRPTLWSATVDALTFGTDVISTDEGLELLSEPDPSFSRLMIVAAGNVRDPYEADYLSLCDRSPVEDPGQAWNALTVGAYTEMIARPTAPALAGYQPLANAGQLSPFSRTSLLFARRWPVKPDIVLEGGNLLSSPQATTFDTDDAVSLLTTSHLEPLGTPFTTVNATSAAATQAARYTAMASSRYPELWPEALRGLLVHAAEWTPAMIDAFSREGTRTGRLQLVRRYGFGVPALDRVMSSLANDVTLIVQSTMSPFRQEEGEAARLREMHILELPWPRDELSELGQTAVRLRVTLSYFVEPNPSSRGWRGRYVYPSHGLRFDIRRPTETMQEFRSRLNRLAQLEESDITSTAHEPSWFLGPNARNVGSLHSDIWEGSASELGNAGALAVYPVGGWWKNNNRADRTDLAVRYALLVSLSAADVPVDLYTPIAVQVGIPISVT